MDNPYTNCPIIELRPDCGVGILALVPLMTSEEDQIAVAETLCATLSLTRGRSVIVTVSPQFDPRQADSMIDSVRLLASQMHQTDLKYRGTKCSTCGYPI
jgi:hypothetical protein